MNTFIDPEDFRSELYEPRVGHQRYLERPQIDKLLENAIQSPVVTITAGAGYGKTHAVYSYISHLNACIVWVQLSEQDNLGAHFWETFLTAVSLKFWDLSILLRQINFPNTQRKFDSYARLPQKIHQSDVKSIFVFDDLHLIQNEDVLRFIERCIYYELSNLSNILISRTEIPFNLIVLESKGQLAKITEENLKFSQEEMLDYFHLIGQNIDPETADSIYHETEGWAFAIYLAGKSLKYALPGSEPVTNTIRSNIFKLIESEIMTVVQPDMRKFLIKLALIDYQPVKLLMEIGGDKSLITGIEQLGTFIQYNSYNDTYHIHYLFLEYLKTLQGELTDEEKQEIFLKAGRWYLANNQKINAINYFEKAKNYDEIIDMTSKTMNIIIPEPIARLLLEVMKKIPEEIFKTNHRLISNFGRVYMALGMLDEGEALLRSAIERLEKETPTEKIYWSLSAIYVTLGSILRRKILYTGNYEYVNFYQKGAYYAELGGFVQKPPLTVATLSSYVCCVSSPERGELERYIRALDEGIPWLEKCMSGCGQGSSDLARGELAFFQGNLQAAEENLLKAIPAAVKYDQFGIEDRSLFYLIRLYINQGNTEKIKSIYEQFKNRLEEPNFITRQIYYDIKTGWVLIQLGDPEQIASWLKNDFELSDHSSLVYGMEILVKAKYHLAMQEYPAALAVLKSQEHGLGNFILGRVEIKVLEAVCYYKMGSKEESFACLDAAWEAAAPNELFMPFTEQGKDMRTLTQAALREGATRIDKEVLSKIHLAASAYGKRLSIVIKQYRHEQKKEPVQELSHREHQILISLFEGLTGEEISAETNLSFNTVKSIIKRIYNKLGAINRVDAIRIASDLGLLDHQ